MATQMTSRDFLEYLIQLIHPEKTLPPFARVNAAMIASMLGTDEKTYQEIKAGLQARVHQAAEELLSDHEFTGLVDRIPFTNGAKVVGFGSSSTDDLLSWFEILRVIFKLRRPQDSIRFINAGVSGDTTTHEIARFNAVVNEQPEWIICHISSNDGRRHGNSPIKPLVSVEETEKNLVMLRHFAASQTKAKWIWMTPTRLIEEKIATFPGFTVGQVMFYNEDSARIAEAVLKQPDPAVNLWELFGQPVNPELVSFDGLHPSLAGYKRIVQALVQELVKNF
jgi:lysophospholipase L1-like esterase